MSTDQYKRHSRAICYSPHPPSLIPLPPSLSLHTDPICGADLLLMFSGSPLTTEDMDHSLDLVAVPE